MLANSDNKQKAGESIRVPSDVSGRDASQHDASQCDVSSHDVSGHANVLAHTISERMRARRKTMHLSQNALARKSGVSLGSLKRFEQESLISLESLLKLSVVLGYEQNFSQLFFEQEANEQEQEPEPEQAETLETMVAQTHELLDRIVLYRMEGASTNAK